MALSGHDRDAACLVGDTTLFVGSAAEQDQRPEQRHRGGLVAGQDHRGDLVAQLIGGEPRAGLRIACGAQQIEQIARRLGRRFGQARPHHLGHQRHPAALEPPAAEVAQRRDRRRQHHVEQMRPRIVHRVLGEHAPHGWSVFPRLQREHRPPGDLQRQALHRGQQVDRLVGLRRQRRGRLVGAGDDVARQHGQGARCERGGDGAALQLPVVAVAEQQAIAGDRTQDADRGGRATVVRVVVHQHVVDRVGCVQQDVAAAEEAAHQHVLLVRPLGPHGERVGADRAEELRQRQFLRGDRRVRRDEQGRRDGVHGGYLVNHRTICQEIDIPSGEFPRRTGPREHARRRAAGTTAGVVLLLRT